MQLATMPRNTTKDDKPQESEGNDEEISTRIHKTIRKRTIDINSKKIDSVQRQSVDKLSQIGHTYQTKDELRSQLIENR